MRTNAAELEPASNAVAILFQLCGIARFFTKYLAVTHQNQKRHNGHNIFKKKHMDMYGNVVHIGGFDLVNVTKREQKRDPNVT